MDLFGGTTPVTKAILVTSVTSTIVTSFIRNPSPSIPQWTLQLAATFPGLQLWRVFTSQLIFGSSSELILGSILLYTFRFFEKAYGSRKFSAFLAFVFVMSTLLQVALLAIWPSLTLRSGAYPLIFALALHWAMDIPRTHSIHLFRLRLSDKALIYLLSLQFVLAASPSSLLPSLCGLLAGFLFRVERLPFKDLRLPSWLIGCCSRNVGPLFQRSSSSPRAQVPAAGTIVNDATGGGGAGGAVGGARPNAAYAPVPLNDFGAVEVDDTMVAQLVSLGYAEPEARAAVLASDNHFDLAVARLLQHR